VELVKGTFNRRLTGPVRLERQFGIMARWAELVPVRKLVYPRAIRHLQEVHELVIDDVRHAATFNRRSHLDVAQAVRPARQ
jgi:hypothetical protein